MKRCDFERVYLQSESRIYPQETVSSVLQCIKAPNQREEIITLSKRRNFLSHRKALQDVTFFFDTLKRCYSGYDFFYPGDGGEIIKREIEKKIESTVFGVTNRKLCNWISELLSGTINDSHFTLSVCNREWRFFSKKVAYVTDLVVRKQSEEVYEVAVGNEVFKKGTNLKKDSLQDYLMPTLVVLDDYKKTDSFYLLGKYTKEETAFVVIDGIKVPTHQIRSDFAKSENKNRFENKEDLVVVTHTTYDMPYEETLINAYCDEGRKASEKSNVILNLSGNGGGKSAFVSAFYKGLSGLDNTFFREAALPFPWELKDGKKTYSIEEEIIKQKGNYDGTLYVVMNKATGSSAEMGVAPSYQLKNSIRVGSATFGCCTFGDCPLYQLPNSKIIFSFGCKVFFHEAFEEGDGFLPDYWIDDEDPVKVVERYIMQ